MTFDPHTTTVLWMGEALWTCPEPRCCGLCDVIRVGRLQPQGGVMSPLLAVILRQQRQEEGLEWR